MKMKEKHNVHIIHQQKEVRHAIFVQMTNLLMLIIQIVLNVLRIVLNVNILNKMKNEKCLRCEIGFGLDEAQEECIQCDESIGEYSDGITPCYSSLNNNVFLFSVKKR